MPKEHRRKTPPASRKTIRGMAYGGEHRWSTLDKAVMARMDHYLDRSESLEVGIEELEYYLLGPEELDVDIRHIALNARGEKHLKALSHTHTPGGQCGAMSCDTRAKVFWSSAKPACTSAKGRRSFWL